jgi:hypothetical protein
MKTQEALPERLRRSGRSRSIFFRPLILPDLARKRRVAAHISVRFNNDEFLYALEAASSASGICGPAGDFKSFTGI